MTPKTSAALLTLALPVVASCGSLAIEPHARHDRFESRFDDTPDRVWIGAHYWANRLQDWRIEDGSAVCVETRPRFGMRTLHLLTWRLAERGEGSFRVRVHVDAPAGDRDGSAAGILFGAGGEHVDPRLTSQVHGAPAEDGGWLALVDGAGRARIVSFEEPVSTGGGQWAMRSDAELEALAAVPGEVRGGAGFGASGPRPVALDLVGATFDGRRTLTLTVRDAASGEVLSTAGLEDAPSSAFDGAVALVSHRGPAGSNVGHRFDGWDVQGEHVVRSLEPFGPILFVHYTVDRRPGGSERLRMTAQAGPLGTSDARTARLEQRVDGRWTAVEVAPYVEGSATFHFDVPLVGSERETPFRVVYEPVGRDGWPRDGDRQEYAVTVTRPLSDDSLTIASLSCQKSFTGGLRWNHDGLWFPHAEVADAVARHEPDLLYFAGDQIYEGDLSPAVRRPEDRALGDYLHKWYRHGWSFGELTRRLPAVVVTDDHDVYHGNIWGNGGVRMDAPEGTTLQDRGGYVMSADFVNAVHRTQVAHLPPPAHTEPLANGVSRYHTTLEFGGGSFAILADRMDKSPPAVVVPEGQVKNGWFQAEGFDPATQADVAGATLLGAEQLEMLAGWARARPDGVWFKACLSQSPFCNVATIPRDATSGSVIPSLRVPAPGEYVSGDKRAADTDSNGWPQSGRDRAVRILREASAFHLTGDQHLGSTVRYGVDEFDDAGYVLSSPAVANTWPRRWYPDPAERQPGSTIAPGAPDYTGRYHDGFGNRMTVVAVANPSANGIEPERLHGRAPGYGIVRVVRDPSAPGGGRVTFEAWPRFAEPGEDSWSPYAGWPVEFPLAAGGGASAESGR